jgi:hypothetical protein
MAMRKWQNALTILEGKGPGRRIHSHEKSALGKSCVSGSKIGEMVPNYRYWTGKTVDAHNLR